MTARGPVAAAAALVLALALARGTAPAAHGARILAVETINGKSHWNFMSAVLRALTDAGHSVTAFTPYPDGDRDNYTELDASGLFPPSVDFDLAAVVRLRDPLACVDALSRHGRLCCDAVHGDGRLGELTRPGGGGTGDRFDVIVAEPPLAVDCLSALARRAGLPIVYAIPSPMITQRERAFTGHYANPAAVSHLLSRDAVPDAFVRRLVNAGLFVYGHLKTGYDGWRLSRADPKPYDSFPIVHPSVVFLNSHHVTEASRPVLPNVVDVGGIHLKPVRAIPEDILDFIEDSPHGVIYFTFGSTVKLSSFPEHLEKAFKDALARVPQRVLWKYEIEMQDMPKNVMIRKWFPQREILMHPKVKLFISHGGISGVYEAVDAGVPVLGFPLIYDQPRNIANLVRAGMAISMDLMTVSEDVLFDAITELIENEEYMKNAKIASHRFKDRPMSPQSLVVYWTEYVIRHKGAPHLKSHALNLTWYQYFLLDVIALVLIFVFLVVYIMYKTFQAIYCYIFNGRNKNKIKTQ